MGLLDWLTHRTREKTYTLPEDAIAYATITHTSATLASLDRTTGIYTLRRRITVPTSTTLQATLNIITGYLLARHHTIYLTLPTDTLPPHTITAITDILNTAPDRHPYPPNTHIHRLDTTTRQNDRNQQWFTAARTDGKVTAARTARDTLSALTDTETSAAGLHTALADTHATRPWQALPYSSDIAMLGEYLHDVPETVCAECGAHWDLCRWDRWQLAKYLIGDHDASELGGIPAPLLPDRPK